MRRAKVHPAAEVAQNPRAASSSKQVGNPSIPSEPKLLDKLRASSQLKSDRTSEQGITCHAVSDCAPLLATHRVATNSSPFSPMLETDNASRRRKNKGELFPSATLGSESLCRLKKRDFPAAPDALPFFGNVLRLAPAPLLPFGLIFPASPFRTPGHVPHLPRLFPSHLCFLQQRPKFSPL